MTDEPQKRRSRRRRRRRPATGDAFTTRTTEGPPRRSRSGGKSRPRSRKRSSSSGRRPRRDRGGNHWWAQRWSKSLDSIRVGRRLSHGRSYARQGRVIEIEIEKGSVVSMVKGSRNAPYLVRMHFAMLSSTDWKKLVGVVSEDIELGGGLFRGEFPPNTEEAFTGLSLPLFPSGGQDDLKAACSCPDQANPCKHVAAVFYALGEEIDRDPFLLFRLRGLDRTELMEGLARTPAARTAVVAPPSAEALARRGNKRVNDERRAQAQAQAQALPDTLARQPHTEPLPADPQLFWAGLERTSAGDGGEEVRVPSVAGALAQRLGGYPFWRGDSACGMVMDQIYRAASSVGLSIYLGEADSEEGEDR